MKIHSKICYVRFIEMWAWMVWGGGFQCHGWAASVDKAFEQMEAAKAKLRAIPLTSA